MVKPDDDRSGFILWALSGLGLWIGIYSTVTVALVTALTIRILTRPPPGNARARSK